MISLNLPAMLLAAGRGERMRPLTDVTPKPLLAVQGKALLDWHMHALQRDGVQQVVVNTAWLGAQIPAHLDAQWPQQGMQLQYSHEQDDFGHALETAGGISRALPLLGDAFWLAAGDVYAPDFVFDPKVATAFARSTDLAHIWLVPNPEHNRKGDFGFVERIRGSGRGRAVNLPPAGETNDFRPRFTYSTIALLKKELFQAPWFDVMPGNPDGIAAPLAPLLRKAMEVGRCSATLYTGRWVDVGTPERLAALNKSS